MTTTTTKKPTATPPTAPLPDTVEFNLTNAPAIRAAKIAEFHKAMADGALGNALPEVYKPGKFVLGDGTIVERR
jgi:hypothetical protein